MLTRLTSLLFFTAATQAYASCVSPACTEFPADAGFINVRDFGAKGDGITDDTAAINAALTESGGDTGPTFWHDKIVYFPDGTYLVSAPINKHYKEGRFASGAVMVGQSREGTILRLKDNAPGYTNPVQPKAVIFTTAKLLDGNATSGGKDYTNKGEGNDAFMNFVENMTINVGTGNPGAIGIDYLANNMGAVRNVDVKAGEGSGLTGISMTRKWPGPALIEHVRVKGFDTGIDIDNTEYGMTLEDIQLEGQRKTGLRNNHNMVSAHNVTIDGAPVAIVNASDDGMVMLADGMLKGKTSSGDAVKNNGHMNLRGVTVTGYASFMNEPLPNAKIDGVYNQEKRISTSKPSWALPVESTPAIPGDPVNQWVNVSAFGIKPDSPKDATDAIRKAFASGASTVYFPHGTYLINENITIPPTVKRIVGMNSTIQALKPRNEVTFRRDFGMFRANNESTPLTIEKLAFDNSYLGDQVGVEAGAGTLILRDVVGAGVTTLKRPASGGKVFAENTCCGFIEVAGEKGIWMRQLNTEGGGVRIKNNGAPLWVLGLKTEGNNTVIESKNNAHTEVLGGLVYIVRKPEKSMPAFDAKDSKISLSFVEEAFNSDNTYMVYLNNSKKNDSRPVKAEALPKRGHAHMVPRLVNEE